MMPGVMISPGLLLDVASDTLEKVLKWRSCCSVLVDLELMVRCCKGAWHTMHKSAGNDHRIFFR